MSEPDQSVTLRRCALHRRFTLLELLVCLVIVGAIMALVGPRIGSLPSRLVIRNATAQLHTAFSDAGIRARTTGRPTTLILFPEQNRLVLLDGTPDEHESLLPFSAAQNLSSPDAAAKISTYSSSYELERHIEWRRGDQNYQPEQKAVFIFFPDGDAVGPTVDFVIRGYHFRLSVARLTGKVNLIEP